LTGGDLKGAHLNGANLTRAYLERGDLKGANLTGAKLSGASLYGARLEGADLTQSAWWATNFTGLSVEDSGIRLSFDRTLVQHLYEAHGIPGDLNREKMHPDVQTFVNELDPVAVRTRAS
jgi:hypothetical protein